MRKNVLITGASSDLGISIASLFAKNGYDIIATYLSNLEGVQALKSKLESTYSINVSLFHVDLRDEKRIEEFVHSIERVDVLVNNAAWNDDCDVFDKGQEDFVTAFKVNAIGPFILSKCLYEKLRSVRGSIVNVASTNGIDTMYPESIDYDSSKAALINITKNLARAFSPEVRVNAVAPGWINTSSTKDMRDTFRDDEEKKILLNRFAEVDEIAQVVYFVASDDASYINGAVLRVDGGISNEY